MKKKVAFWWLAIVLYLLGAGGAFRVAYDRGTERHIQKEAERIALVEEVCGQEPLNWSDENPQPWSDRHDGPRDYCEHTHGLHYPGDNTVFGAAVLAIAWPIYLPLLLGAELAQ